MQYRHLIALLLCLLAPASPALAAGQTADAFVRGIYTRYLGDADTTGKGIDLVKRAAFRRYFAPDIAAVMIKDEEAAARVGDESSLDFDPFVAAQDWTITGLTIHIDPKSESAANAIVRFKNLGKDETVRLMLVRTANGWRISDIAWPDNNGTLRGLYKKP